MTSNVGDAFYSVALPWYVLATHGGPLLLGTVLAAYGVPRTVLVAIAGHASDRWKPWTVMMTADALRAVAVGALAVEAALGPAHAAQLVPVAAVLGAGEGLFVPGSFAIVAGSVGRGPITTGSEPACDATAHTVSADTKFGS
jgi:MFS family permease